MRKTVAYAVVLIIFSVKLLAQPAYKVSLSPEKYKLATTPMQLSEESLSFSFSIPELYFRSVTNIYGQEFFSLESDELKKDFRTGNPGLPTFNRLVEIPAGYEVKIVIHGFEEQLVALREHGLDAPILPAQLPQPKSKPLADSLLWQINEDLYSTNQFYKPEFASLQQAGQLRNQRIALLKVNPFEYNPVTGELLIKNNIRLSLDFIKKGEPVLKRVKQERLFRIPLPTMAEQNQATQIKVQQQERAEVKYIIMSAPMFKEALKPFIKWKRQKGFIVEDYYTDDPRIGVSKETIKSFLNRLYQYPEDNIKPTYVLLVGDIAQIPAYRNNDENHYTDLYYFEYTNDNLPDVYYGRFSAETVEELQAQIDKTLQLEKFTLTDYQFLEKALLIAGVDATYAPTHGNGAVYYASTNYFTPENGYQSYNYFYNKEGEELNSNSSSAYSDIIRHINEGVGFGNYTAHCNYNGWSNPALVNNHVKNLSNTNHYPVLVGNCCLSAKFDYNDCFGEVLLTSPNKGAVAYIGGSNYTYWDEDYWWAIGLTNQITATPQFATTGTGVFDGLFNSLEQNKSQWFNTLGQMVRAGNLQVESSNSHLKQYYWEIYHCLGDPSFAPYLGIPQELQVSHPALIQADEESFQVQTEPNALVALSLDGEYISSFYTPESGTVNFPVDLLTQAGPYTIVVTKPNRIPYISDLTLAREEPYITVEEMQWLNQDNVEVDALEYGREYTLRVNIVNNSVSNEAISVETNLIFPESYLTLVSGKKGGVSLGPEKSTVLYYKINVKDSIPDMVDAQLQFEFISKDAEGGVFTMDETHSVKLHAPDVRLLGTLKIDDKNGGDQDNIAEAGEEVLVRLTVKNFGHSRISKLGFSLAPVKQTQFCDIITSSLSLSSLASGAEVSLSFKAQIKDGDIPFNYIDSLKFTFVGGENGQYESVQLLGVMLNEIPVFKISNQGVHPIEAAWFYDSGGNEYAYSSQEDYEITFAPYNQEHLLVVDFYEYHTESSPTGCYDYLEAYNTTGQLMHPQCGDAIPESIRTNFPGESITFHFAADQSIQRLGWKALVREEIPQKVIVYVYDQQKLPVEHAMIEALGHHPVYSNTDGQAVISNCYEGEELNLKVSAEGYKSQSMDFSVTPSALLSVHLQKVFSAVIRVMSDGHPIANATVVVNGGMQYVTNTEGIAYVKDLNEGEALQYTISAKGYVTKSGSITLKSNNVYKDIEISPYKYTTQFIVKNNQKLVNQAMVVVGKTKQYTNSEGSTFFFLPSGWNSYSVFLAEKQVLSDSLFVNFADTIETITLTTTDISDISEGVSIFPNPAHEFIKIISSQPLSGKMEIRNMAGEVMLLQSIDGNLIEIDVESLADGIYLLIINTKEVRINQRLIIK